MNPARANRVRAFHPGTVLTAALALLALAPIALVLVRGLPTAAGVIVRDTDVLLTTAGLVGLGTLLALLIGGGLAVMTFEAGLPRWVDALVSVPYLVPPFIGATAWLAALGAGNPFTGTVIVNVYGWGGILLAWTTHYSPLAYLLVRASLEAQSISLAQAGRIHGLTRWRVLTRITLPLARPGLIASGLLLALTLLGNFGVPAVLGFPAKVYTLASLAYARLLNPTLPDSLAAASGVAVVLVVVALPALLLNPVASGGGQSTEFRPSAGRGERNLAFALVGVWVLIAVLIPLLSIILLAFRPAYGTGVSLEHFRLAFGLAQVRTGLQNSLLLAVAAGTMAAGLGLLLARAERASRVVARLTRALRLAYLLPGTILAIGFILAYGGTALYATPAILGLAYLARFLTPGLESARAGLAARGLALELAARVHGVPAGLAFRRVTLPLLRPNLVAAFVLVFPLALSEITLSSILYAPGSETVGVAVLGLLNEGNLRGAAAVATVLVALCLPTLLIGRRAG